MQLHNKAEGQTFRTGKFRKGGARGNVMLEIMSW